MKTILSVLSVFVFFAVDALAEPIEIVDSSRNGMTCELKKVTRKKGVLSVKFALHAKEDTFRNGRPEMVFSKDQKGCSYVLDEEKGIKYFPLEDEKGAPVATTADPYMTKGDRINMWMKVPAPPAEVKSVSISLTHCEPFDDIDIVDK
jgi:hypothetical protein